MARKNRVSVHDGIYHVTARIANRAMLLAEDEIKDKILEWIVSVAAFSGIEVWSFAIMDNHLHLFVHVPPVPKRYWLDPDDEPCAYAFGMRPPECREPLWSPNGDSPSGTDGDSPSCAGCGTNGDSPRPSPGFMLADDEMLDRLGHLYGPKRVEAIEKAWTSLREHGCGHAVELRKERYCRRMYNLSQFVKTLKERISMWYNDEYGHAGCLWGGRFYSGVVEKSDVVKTIVSAYIGYNPVKAKLVASPADWRWSSYALAVAGDSAHSGYCRRMYELMLGCPWDEVRAKLESAYADKLPDSLTPEALKEMLDDYDAEAKNQNVSGVGVYRASQAIRATMKLFSGAYIGCSAEFVRRAVSGLPERFPRAGMRSVRRCMAFRWELPEPLRSAA